MLLLGLLVLVFLGAGGGCFGFFCFLFCCFRSGFLVLNIRDFICVLCCFDCVVFGFRFCGLLHYFLVLFCVIFFAGQKYGALFCFSH